ncbi:DUF6930 domain-containing protein [Agrilactobacillus fermenti]|uniref:DUF6930 domain-containing protein n=1 Tax=Agrilactobacillus fermenti TaxID=2586909 RepID=UPI001E55BDAD|nr:hypothetical protein [Agrilactobacillus fermenti]MCD2255725.1 hypothetical protein [Agrilactobacillus fermenti]
MPTNQALHLAIDQIKTFAPWKVFWPSDPLALANAHTNLFAVVQFISPQYWRITYTDQGLRYLRIQTETGFEVWEPSQLYQDYLAIDLRSEPAFTKKVAGITEPLHAEDQATIETVILQLVDLLQQLPSHKRITTQLDQHKVPFLQFTETTNHLSFKQFKLPRQSALFSSIKTTGLSRLQNAPLQPLSVEFAVTYLPQQVTNTQEKAFYPQLLLAMDHTSGQVISQDVLDPKLTEAENIRQWLLDLLQRFGKPSNIYTHFGEGQQLKKIATKLGIDLVTDVPLKYVGQLYQALTSELAQV